MERRTLLKLGTAAALTLAVAGGGLALWRPGWREGRLTEDGRALFSALTAAVLGDLVPADPAQRQRALAGQIERLEATIAGFTPAMQAELEQLLGLLCTAPGRLAFTGQTSGWREASVDEVQATLRGLRDSSLALRQQAYHGLRDLCNGAWFAEPLNARQIGYPGPMTI